MDAEKLSRFRVDHGIGGYRSMEMTEEEKIARRCFIFGIIRDNAKWKLAPEQVDDVRIFRMGDLMILEDADFIEHII